MSGKMHRFGFLVTAVVVAVVALGLWQAVSAQPASAHGKDLDIAVTPLIPDPDRPLLRLYRVEVVYLGDREAVEGATVTLTAARDDGTVGFPPVELTEVDEGDGLYVGEAVFSRFGVWEMELSVVADQGLGEGDVSFQDNIRPGALNPEQVAALEAEADRVIRLQLSFGFSWWPDVVNIAIRVVHSLAGLSYFMITAVAFGMAWFGVPPGPLNVPRLLNRTFLPGAGFSLAVLLGAGLYSAAYDAPITSPGIYDIERMREIPYGEWYLLAFAIKVVAFVVLAVLAVWIYRVIREWNAAEGDKPAITTVATLKRATMANAVVGVIVVADVAALIYLHYISHLGVFLPES